MRCLESLMVLHTAWMAMGLHLMLKQSVAMVAKRLGVELALTFCLALPLMSQAAVVVVAAAVAVVIESMLRVKQKRL